MTGAELIVGLDAGGTKLGVRAEALDGSRVADVALPAEEWSASPAGDAARWLHARIRRVLPEGSTVVALGVGAQGLDTVEHADELGDELGALGYRAAVVNDAQLLVPAAGLRSGIGVIAGTGSIAVGSDASGRTLFAGGWGWVLGDEGGAPAIVREATIAALRADDEGAPDDGLLSGLVRAFGVDAAPALARAVNDDPTPENWGPRAIAVFAAADAGSVLATGVIESAGQSLAALVDRLVARGATGSDVVVAGSVFVHQPRLLAAFTRTLGTTRPALAVVPLSDAPVAGAVELARRLVS
ncbi:ATPase [Leifsonia sp. LS1]|uniref:BadF/BadG/BcrA/BcrD ATPase family protein n=1 Tax=Leifsonia sp. LS1 TaxID=2828483 RepID=UPI001CFEA5C9|nr:BadF/BadG/BcrA/BcrD ATPase family protein [Leifsonia sp. LS1]GIT80855.1 ATPase [Leifsonia sp. LS1]